MALFFWPFLKFLAVGVELRPTAYNNDLFVKHINVYIKVESLASAHHVQSLTLAVNLCVVSGPNTIVCKLKKKGEE